MRVTVGLLCLAVLGCKGSSGKAASPDLSHPPPDAGCTAVVATLDPTRVQQGLQLVQQNRCQQCHGELLDGNYDGVFVPNSDGIAYPPNLTPDPATGLGCWTDAQIVNAILNGTDNQGMGLCAPMPHFIHAGLDETSASAIVQFLRSLPIQINQVPNTPDCSCKTDNDCPAGEVCLAQTCSCDGVCAVPDGGVAPDDAIATDGAGTLDGGLTDASNRD
jgi:hypothetical protein